MVQIFSNLEFVDNAVRVSNLFISKSFRKRGSFIRNFSMKVIEFLVFLTQFRSLHQLLPWFRPRLTSLVARSSLHTLSHIFCHFNECLISAVVPSSQLPMVSLQLTATIPQASSLLLPVPITSGRTNLLNRRPA